jgi:LPXTG-motif cell wall-anchored protein
VLELVQGVDVTFEVIVYPLVGLSALIGALALWRRRR